MSKTRPQLERPRNQRVYVTVMDGETKRTKTITVYGTTPESVLRLLEKAIESLVVGPSEARQSATTPA